MFCCDAVLTPNRKLCDVNHLDDCVERFAYTSELGELVPGNVEGQTAQEVHVRYDLAAERGFCSLSHVGNKFDAEVTKQCCGSRVLFLVHRMCFSASPNMFVAK